MFVFLHQVHEVVSHAPDMCVVRAQEANHMLEYLLLHRHSIRVI